MGSIVHRKRKKRPYHEHIPKGTGQRDRLQQSCSSSRIVLGLGAYAVSYVRYINEVKAKTHSSVSTRVQKLTGRAS
jgi:hypothetical protein